LDILGVGVDVLEPRVLEVSLVGGVVPDLSSNCLAVMPKYLDARDPAVILASARAALVAVLLPRSVRRPASVGVWVASSLGRAAIERVKPGVVAPARRVRSAAGV
jgi:hypothetical protein